MAACSTTLALAAGSPHSTSWPTQTRPIFRTIGNANHLYYDTSLFVESNIPLFQLRHLRQTGGWLLLHQVHQVYRHQQLQLGHRHSHWKRLLLHERLCPHWGWERQGKLWKKSIYWAIISFSAASDQCRKPGNNNSVNSRYCGTVLSTLGAEATANMDIGLCSKFNHKLNKIIPFFNHSI